MDHAEHLCPAYPDQTVVLLVEDDVMVRNVARMVLESEGYFILTAAHGVEALHISAKFPSVIHLLLSDVRMPVMDGWRLMEQIIPKRPEIKILLMSGEAPSGVDIPFLRKPFRPDALKQKVKSLLREPKLYPRGGTMSE